MGRGCRMIVFVLLEEHCCDGSIVMGILTSEDEALDWVAVAPNRGYRVFRVGEIHND